MCPVATIPRHFLLPAVLPSCSCLFLIPPGPSRCFTEQDSKAANGRASSSAFEAGFGVGFVLCLVCHSQFFTRADFHPPLAP